MPCPYTLGYNVVLHLNGNRYKQQGRKRFITVDTLGLLLRVLVTAANVGERSGGQQVFQRVKHSQLQSRLTTIWVDGGFDGEPFMEWVMNFCRWIIQVVLRPKETKGFVYEEIIDEYILCRDGD